jgi:CRP-like cAMP-binding protein
MEAIFMPVQTIDYQILRNSFLFKDVDNMLLRLIASHLQPMTLYAGDTLFEQDAEADAMYFLESGQIHVIREYPDGDEVILATEVPYYVIGELSMLANEPRTGKVVAVGDCDLLKLSREDFLHLVKITPEIAVSALDDLGKRLYKLNLRVRESAIGNVAARVASVLLLMGDSKDKLSVTRIARATAMDTDVVDRLLRGWEQEKIISLKDEGLKILNMTALQNLAG